MIRMEASVNAIPVAVDLETTRDTHTRCSGRQHESHVGIRVERASTQAPAAAAAGVEAESVRQRGKKEIQIKKRHFESLTRTPVSLLHAKYRGFSVLLTQTSGA